MEQWTGETATPSPLQPLQQADNYNSTNPYMYYYAWTDQM